MNRHHYHRHHHHHHHHLAWVCLKVIGLISMISHLEANQHSTESLTIPITPKCPLICTCKDNVTVDCSNNELTSLPSNISPSVQRLNLNFNKLSNLTQGDRIFHSYSNLTHLFLSGNMIGEISEKVFDGLETVISLDLSNNNINHIHPQAFHSLVRLKDLDLSGNSLMDIPVAIRKLVSLKELMINKNKIKSIERDTFSHNNHIQLIEIKGNPIKNLDHQSFTNLTRLRKLVISDARGITDWPNLSNAISLQHISFDRTNIKSIAISLCITSPNLKSLVVKSSRLQNLPILQNCGKLEMLDLSYNEIMMIGENNFISQRRLTHLFLSHNWIDSIKETSLNGLDGLTMLDLSNNLINFIHPNAFLPCLNLKDLNLGENRFPVLPTNGLRSLHQIKVHSNPYLTQFPGPENFPSVQVLALSYAYHCCQYANLGTETTTRANHFEENIIWLHRDDVNMSAWNATWPNTWTVKTNFSAELDQTAWTPETESLLRNMFQFSEEYLEDYRTEINNYENILIRYPVKCLPQPSPFMPCEDLFDWWTLRCGVWIVFLLALLGNGVVVIVLLFGRSKLDVPRFLVCNLALADFLMGIYLGMLAIVDAATLGEYKVYAIPWQRSFGCQIAGFLGVLSTELSVYTLAVITSERNYAITHAMHLNKRLSLKHASYIMAFGWVFALFMAILPLLGISDYRKFAVCLPFEISDFWSMVYVISLIAVNGIAFFILMGCYLRMYCAIRGSQAWNSNDSRIAKRMALLVFTDFLCWAPIAFFSLTAIAGYELITLTEAKVFTVFVLPLNSCANPFLYAIFTKQFKKDCVLLCKRIEESRVTRGIGRGRNSSNFSNRHTPVNTNSAIDKKSSVDSNPLVCQCGLTAVVGTPTVSINRFRPNLSQPLFRRMASLWWQGRGTGVKEMAQLDSADSANFPSQTTRRGTAPNNRLDSISSGNFSSRSDSWRQSYLSPQLLALKRPAAMIRRRSSWTASSSTSTRKLSTTRSSVSSDSSSTVFKYDLKTVPRIPQVEEYLMKIGSGQFGKPGYRLQAKNFLCADCARRGMTRPQGLSSNIALNLAARFGKETEKIMMSTSTANSTANRISTHDISRKYFKKLSESSQEDGNESREEHFIISSGESVKGETTETSLQDSFATDSQIESSLSTSFSPPLTEIQIECADENDLFSSERDHDASLNLYPEPESRASSNLSIRTQIPRNGASTPMKFRIGSDSEINDLSSSIHHHHHHHHHYHQHPNITILGEPEVHGNGTGSMNLESNLTRYRKVSSDNSLKAPFPGLPSLFKSFSSLGSQLFRSSSKSDEISHDKGKLSPASHPKSKLKNINQQHLSPYYNDYSIRISKSCQTIVTSENFESTLRKSCTISQITDKTWKPGSQTINRDNADKLVKSSSLLSSSINITVPDEESQNCNQNEENVPLLLSLTKNKDSTNNC